VTYSSPRVGVLCLQGSFAEHISKLTDLGANAVEVRLPSQLDGLDALVIPGGESTTFLKLIDVFELRKPLCRAIADGLPVLATCAGVVILATRISSHGMNSLGLLDIDVARNAFGRQVESFEEDLVIEGIPGPVFRGVFIRAPIILSCGKGVDVLARVQDGTIVACRQGRILATSFHPEFVPDRRVHEYFLRMAGNGRRDPKSETG
jgi:5'-phosphate synthase pdxT subunit